MYLIDRLMLAGYSIDSMTASVIAGHFVSTFSFLLIGLADSAEVFVGQYNGSKQYEKLAAPTWQMIYMSAFACLPCFLIAYFSDYLNMYPSYYAKEGIAYQKILMYFAALPSIKVALAAFFIGQGKTRIIAISIAIGVLSNIFLAYFLIYEADMGCSGAAIATVISEVIQIAILAFVFFKRSNRENYRTFQNRSFNGCLFKECLRIGFPISFGNFIMIFAWYVMQITVSHVSKDEATVFGICTSLYIFFIFVAEGVNKGSAAVSANMIGCRDLGSIEKTRKTFVKISLFFGAIIAIPLVLSPEWIIRLLNMASDDISRLHSEIKICLILLAINVTIETLLYSIWGILIAGGDSKYATIVNQLCFWVIVFGPITVLYCSMRYVSVPLLYTLVACWMVCNQIILHRRYKSLKWYKRLV
jgi:MATE family multidrug resistance protein